MVGVALLAACGEDETEPPPSEQPPGLVAPAEGEGVQIHMSVTVPAGEEHTFCQYDRMPASAAGIQRFEHLYTGASHHLLVYRTTHMPDAVPLGVPFE